MYIVNTYILLYSHTSHNYTYYSHKHKHICIHTVSGAGPDLLGLQARLVHSAAGTHAVHCTEQLTCIYIYI